MKKLLASLLTLLLLFFVCSGCALNGNIPSESPAETQDTASGTVTPLTAAELAYWNGEEFFNGQHMNIRNQFLSSLYDEPAQINLFELFYTGSGYEDYSTMEEFDAVIAKNGWDSAPDNACTKNSRASMDAVLTEYMGLTLDETDKVGLENFTYLDEYDAYYYFHGDTNYRSSIEFSSAEREGDIIRLYYNDSFYADGYKVLTMRETAAGHLFVSNQAISGIGSVHNPDGIVADDIAVPETVLDVARRGYVALEYDKWCSSTGVYTIVDGEERMIGVPATYDNWRIEGLSLVYSYSDIGGEPPDSYRLETDSNWGTVSVWDSIKVYQIYFRIHTTTPDKVILAGGMELDDDGWLSTGATNGAYLIFASSDEPLRHLFTITTNDATPGLKAFTDELKSKLTIRANKESLIALAIMNGIFADSEPVISYLASGEDAPQTDDKRSYTLGESHRARYELLFKYCYWESLDAANISEPTGASLMLGNSTDAYFRFYLGSDIVVWIDGESVSVWRVNPLTGWGVETLPDTMMKEFSRYEDEASN